jgi:hypothetical protein
MADLLAKQFAETSSDEHCSQTFKKKKNKAEETGITGRSVGKLHGIINCI